MDNKFALGLDLGTNSIGWALIGINGKRAPQSIIACGSRVFQEAVDPKSRVPKNQARREARSARRLGARRKMRQQNLLNLLVANNLLPANDKEREKLFSNESLDPYHLRKKGLDVKLEPYEFGRALFHLGRRRGFKSNRKASKEEDGIVNAAITSLQKDMLTSKARTLGEHLANQTKKRGLYTSRSMYEQEYELIWQSQQSYYPETLNSLVKIKVHNAIFFQRPLKSQKYLVGKCTFEPSRKRAAKALLQYQRFRILQDVNHLLIKNPITRQYRPLEKNEKQEILGILEKQKTLSWGRARKVLKLQAAEVFNLEEGKKKELIGNRTAYNLRSVLKEKWDNMLPDQQNSLITDMLTINDVKGFINRMTTYWGFDDDTAEELAKTELEPGYANLSHKAMNKIIPFLEKGLIYYMACLESGYNHSAPGTQKIQNMLGEPPYLRNPIVQKALFETRKLINAIIRKHGKPKVIRVEMARDMKLSRRQRQEVEKNQRKREKENDLAREKLQEDFGLQHPTREDVQKYNLWQECKMLCPYTGQSISAEMLFSEEVDIEHIIPYSRCLDDSYMNKTLCLASENRSVKRNKTPYEAYHGNETKYREILSRTKDLPFPKRRKFELKEVNTDEFVSRQLNDTRYICREVKNYLQQLGVTVDVTKGSATAALRHQWNLNSILADGKEAEKNRNDHRHHTVDAIAIALTSKALFQKLSMISSQSGKSLYQRGFDLEYPWPSFYEDVDQKIQKVIVSHSPARKLSGALHKETAYGYSESENCYVFRKPLSSLSVKQIEKIRDLKIKALVKYRLQEFNGDFKKAFGNEDNPLLHKDGKTPIRSVRLVEEFSKDSVHPIKNKDNKPFKFFKLGNNHHVEIIEDKEGKRKGIFVTTIEAAKRARQYNQPFVNRNHGDDWQYIMSLCRNDMLEMENNGEPIYYRVQKMSGPQKQVTLRLHTSTSTSDYDKKPEVLSVSASSLIAKKVTVDCLGNISSCNN